MAKDRILKIFLKCTVCGERNYTTFKKRTMEGKLERNKFCRRCSQHQPHKESKISTARK